MKIIEDGTVTNPKGYKGAGLHIGIKKRNKDFALIVSDVEAKAVCISWSEKKQNLQAEAFPR